VLAVFVMKLKYVEEKLWKSRSIQTDVLEKQEKRIRSKDKTEKKMINQTKKSVHPSAKRNGNRTIILKNLSQLFGA